jgi:hypothetical protein
MKEQWRRIEDSLPEPMTNVLVYIIGDATPEIVTSYWDKKDDEPDEDGFLFIRWYYEGQPMYHTSWYQRVTHWMPLPEAPTND